MNLHTNVIQISLDDIVANPYQPRKKFSEEELIELAESIKNMGLIQPITVRKLANKYEIIVGERRFRAAKLAGLKYISAIVVRFTDEQSAVIALIENIQRQDLNFIEEAEALAMLLEKYGFTQKELAIKIGKKQSTVSNKLRLLTLPEIIKDLLVMNDLTERHGRALLKLKSEDDIHHVIKAVIKNNLTVKATEKLIDSLLLDPPQVDESKQNIKYSINYKIYVNTVKHAYESILNTGAAVKYSEKDKGDYIEVTLKIPKESKI